MIFDTTSSDIRLYEKNGRQIKLEELFSLLSSVIKDVYRDAHVDGAEELEIQDYEKLIPSVIYILQEACAAAESSSHGAHKVEGLTLQTLKAESDKAASSKAEWSQIERELTAAKNSLAQLQSEFERAERDRGHLREASAECERLRQEINKLNDPLLDSKDKERDALREELAERESRMLAVNQDIDGLKEKSKKAEADIGAANTKKAECEAELATKERELADIRAKVTTVESDVSKKSTEVEQAERELNELLASMADRIQRLNERESRYASTYTALHSYLNEEFIADNLFGAANAAEVLSTADVPDLPGVGRKITSVPDLSKWLSDVELRLDGLSKVYRAELQRIISASESLTKSTPGSDM